MSNNLKDNYLSTIYDEESHPYTSYPEKLCKHLFKLFNMKKNQEMLEIGCGRGEFLSGFRNLGLKVKGVDLSKEVKENLTKFDISTINAENDALPFEDNSLDIIFTKSFIEHLNSPDNFLSESYRVLKAGGVLLTLTPDWESNMQIFYDDFTHKTPFTKVSLSDAYKMSGFVNTNVFLFRQLPIVWKFPFIGIICSLVSPFVPVRTKNKFFRWSRELMIIAHGIKPQ